LNELNASHSHAGNRLIDIEDLTETELEVLRKFYARLAEVSKKEKSIFKTHFIDEAEINSAEKQRGSKIGLVRIQNKKRMPG